MRVVHLQRSVINFAEALEHEADWLARETGQRPYRRTFITLTYRNVDDWNPGHISRFIRLMRQWFSRQKYIHPNGERLGHKCRFVWVAELQKRGALHYHVLVFVPRSLRLPKPDESGWWLHGFSKIETARNPVGYMVKYVSKITSDALKRFPKGVRIHGNGGLYKPNATYIRNKFRSRWMSDILFQREMEERDEEEMQALEISRQEVVLEDGRHRLTVQYADGTERSCEFTQEELDELFIRRFTEEQGTLRTGQPRYKKISGGYTDVLSGEFFETPWRVIRLPNGQVMCVPKTERSDERNKEDAAG